VDQNKGILSDNGWRIKEGRDGVGAEADGMAPCQPIKRPGTSTRQEVREGHTSHR